MAKLWPNRTNYGILLLQDFDPAGPSLAWASARRATGDSAIKNWRFEPERKDGLAVR